MSNNSTINNQKSLYTKSSSRVVRDAIGYGAIGLSTFVTIGVLLWIISFIFIKGVPHINWHFLTSEFDDVISILQIEPSECDTNQLGIVLEPVKYEKYEYLKIVKIENGSNVTKGIDPAGNIYKIKVNDVIKGIGSKSMKNKTPEEAYEIINSMTGDTIKVKSVRIGGGIVPMVITTIYMILLSLAISCPIGICAAIYLVEYAKPGRLVRIIRFATESLSGIPSIIFGLFGVIMFVEIFGFKMSILSGACTLAIILLPTIIRQTEESLKAIPNSYREGSLGLGATKLYTITKVVLPNAVPGILVAVILSIGRIVGESAALLLTAGTSAKIPESIFSTGATLTIRSYMYAKEHGDIGQACAIGTVIIVIILILNGTSKIVTNRMLNKNR